MRPSPAVLRYGAGLIGLAAFLVLLVLRAEDFPLFRALVSVQDGFHLAPPFNDLSAILQAGVCWRHGVDVYGPNACMGGGEYNYSPFLLRAAYLPIDPRDSMAGGVLLCLAFMAAISALPRPKSTTDMLFRATAILSPATVFALGQANFDVLVFILTIGAAWLIARARIARIFGYAILAAAAAAKFYPVAALALLLRERLAVVIGTGLCLALGGVVFLYLYGAGIEAAMTILPQFQPFRATFGAIDLPLGLIILHILPAAPFSLHTAQFNPGAAGAAGLIPAGTIAHILLIPALLAAFATRRRYQAGFAALDRSRAICLLAGALMAIFCFAAAQNLYYRAILLILTIPGLWQMRGTNALRIGIMLLLWQSALVVLIAAILPSPVQILFWLVKEGLWWWVIVQLAAITMGFAAMSGARLRQELQSLTPA